MSVSSATVWSECPAYQIDEQFAASSFGTHSLIGTISVITAVSEASTTPVKDANNQCMSSIAPPFIAKIGLSHLSLTLRHLLT